MHLPACKLRHFSFVVTLTLVISALLLAGCGSSNGKSSQRDRTASAVPVAVQTVQPGMVDIYATYPGRIHGSGEVEIRSRVEGILLNVKYNEGEFVERGELLFTIDPDQFVITVEQRKAQLAQAKAQLNQAQQIWERVSRLYEVNAVSEARRDKAYAKLKDAQAGVELATANLSEAQLRLEYSTIEAPVGGVTSLREIDEGSLVTPGTLMTTVTELEPVYVLFSVPAEDALMRQKALAAMNGKTEVTRKVEVILPSGKVYEQKGVVDFTQSTIDSSTGTVRMRAVFDNAKHELVPGRFVRVRMRLETRKNTVVIPNKAITDSQFRTRVLVVTDKGKAKAVPVKLGPAVANGRIIESGLEPGDRVITIGLGQVKPGEDVKIKPADALALGGQSGNTGQSLGTNKASTKSTSTSGKGQSDAAGATSSETVGN